MLRLAGLQDEKKAEIISDLFRERGGEFANYFSVIAPGKIRIRQKEET